MKEKTSINEEHRLGAFSGVFTPSILTIFGIIMFMRFGYVVGQAGLWGSSIILLVSSIIAIITALSLVTIVSNMKVEGGGLYFLISRSLGGEFGAPCGIILFFAQTLSVAFYIIGCTEILCSIMPSLTEYSQILSTIICVLLFILVNIGVNWATKTQFFIMALLFLALFSFLGGSITKFDSGFFTSNLHFTKPNLWIMFALFFPAITGFTQGTSMSGDLKNPERDIPRGIFAAVLLGIIVYGSALWILGGAAPSSVLQTDFMIAKRLSFWPFMINMGIICGAISSALASFLGAPRILQALSRDSIYKILTPVAKGDGALNEPRVATLISFIIALICIWSADLNKLAPVVTMFFLLTYALMNYSTFYEGYSNLPSFRPKFKFFNWRISLLGALVCIGAMFAINWQASLIAIIIIAVLFLYTQKTISDKTFDDAKSGFYFTKTKKYLSKLSNEPTHSKGWRPHIIAFYGNPESRGALVYFSERLEGGRGMTTLAHVIIGELEDQHKTKEAEEKSMAEFVKKNNLDVFTKVIVAPRFIDGATALIQTHGVSDLRPNSILLGWTQRKDYMSYVSLLKNIELLKKNIIIIGGKKEWFDKVVERVKANSKKPTIDIWWRGRKNGRLMLLLAYLLTQDKGWSGATIRLIRIIKKEENTEASQKLLQELSESSRIPCEIKVCLAKESIQDTIIETSQSSSMVFLGLAIPTPEREKAFFETYSHYINNLPMTAFVMCQEDIDLV